MKWLGFVLLIVFCSLASAQDDSEINNPWGPWELKCEPVLFPTREIANAFLNNKRFKVHSCFAKQTVQSFVRGRWIEGMLYLRPVSITFEVNNMNKKIKKPSVVIVQDDTTIKSFGFYDNCLPNEEAYSCSFFPEDKNQMKQLVKIMSQFPQIKLQLKMESIDYPVELEFTTRNFYELYKIVSDTYTQMEEIFGSAHVSHASVYQ